MFYRTRLKNILCRNVVFLSSYEFVWACFYDWHKVFVCFVERRTMYLGFFVK